MILSDKDIIYNVNMGNLVIDPYGVNQLNPSSYDFRLSNKFARVYGRSKEYGSIFIDLAKASEDMIVNEFSADNICLGPGDFVLGITEEYFKFPDHITGRITDKSTMLRLGLTCGRGWFDCGFQGYAVLEIKNNHPINTYMLYAGQRIGQMVFAETFSRSEKPYQGSYQVQRDFAIDKFKLSVQKLYDERKVV